MAEAGELAHWGILAKLDETANDAEIARIVWFALPLQQGHVDTGREQSLRLAGSEDRAQRDSKPIDIPPEPLRNR